MACKIACKCCRIF